MPAASRTLELRRQRVAAILPILQRLYPDARCSLNFSNPLELLVATILSAQCTDARVNEVTRTLFQKFRTAADYAQLTPEQLEPYIRSTGFYRNKARAIVAMARELVDKYGGEVPRTMEQLHALAGVGRKTANVVLGNAFGIDEGITVDTHVTRLSNRLGLTSHRNDAVKIEQDLMKVVPKEHWTLFSHLLIHHGRAVCDARRPQCDRCELFPWCPSGPKLLKAKQSKARAAAAKPGQPRKKPIARAERLPAAARPRSKAAATRRTST